MPLTGITSVRPTGNTRVQPAIYGATVSVGQSLYLDPTDNKHKLSDSNLSAVASASRGIAITSGVDTSGGFIAVDGSIILVGTTMEIGETYYVGPTAGQIIAASELTTGDNVHRLGTAATTTQLDLDIKATGTVRIDPPEDLSESQWEALNEYDYAKTYVVSGVGTYLGPTLITPAPWAPNTGVDLYVATTGNDANPGTDPLNPKLTIWSAFNSISVSNTGPITVWVEAGTYTEDWSGGYMLFTKAFAHMVTVRGKPGTRPIVTAASGSYVIRPNGTSANIRFRNLEIQTIAATVTPIFYNGTNLTNFELVECLLSDANSKTSAISITGASGQSGVAIKRCTLTSAAAFSTTLNNHTNCKFIGNNYLGTLTGQINVNTGTQAVNSNRTIGPIQLIGHATTPTAFTVSGNSCRNIVYTGGATGNKSVLTIDRNTVTAGSGVRGIAVSGYTSGGTCNNNTITSEGDTGLGWPIDGGTSECIGHSITGNSIINTGATGHGLLISIGGTNAIASGNTVDASGGGGTYGLVLKGTNNTANGNTFIGGSLNGVLIKDATGATVTNNMVTSGGASAVALRFDLAPSSVVIGNTFLVTNGSLYSIANVAAAGLNIVVNNNTYNIDSPGVWGTMFGNTVSSLANVQAQWASWYETVETNDSASVQI